MEQALAKVSEFVEGRNGGSPKRLHTIFAANPEKNFSVPKDPLLYSLFKSADLLVPDGIGLVLALKTLYGVRLKRVPGCELMQNVCALSADRGYKIFIYGAREEVNQRAVESLRERFPGIQIVGNVNGYLPEDKMADLVEQINRSGAQILFLALGSPKQEQWISKYGANLKSVKVCQGIGGTLDVLAGTVERAPEVFCSLGLEWLYRLVTEPKRLRRQLVLPVFAWQVLREKFSRR